jgi:OOP family OmpA-OmpF porin
MIGYDKKSPAIYEAAQKNLYSAAAKANMRVLFEIFVQWERRGKGPEKL